MEPKHISSGTRTLIIFKGNLLNQYGSFKYYKVFTVIGAPLKHGPLNS